MTPSRRQFIRFVPTLGAFAIVPGIRHRDDLTTMSGTEQPATAAQATPAQPDWPAPPAPGSPVDESFPSLHLSLVKDVVGVSHFNLARVKELV